MWVLSKLYLNFNSYIYYGTEKAEMENLSNLKLTKVKKAQLMARMITGEQLPELETRFWKTRSGLVPILRNSTGFITVGEEVSISEPHIYKK